MRKAGLAALMVSILWLSSPEGSTAQTRANTNRKEGTVSRAVGTFEVKLAPQSTDDVDGVPLGRMSIDKQYRGDLEGTAKGEMLTALTPNQGSAGYVAIERVTGTLHGRRGSFVLQHNGLMTRGAQSLKIVVVPDSGTGELAGISGEMTIKIEGAKHSYEFEYVLSGK